MDAEVLKCDRTHDIMARCIPQTRKLMHMMCYLNDVKGTDDEFVDFKRRCADKLSVSFNKTIPKVNIASFGLDSCNLALYHQCVRESGERMGDVRGMIEAWKRIMLGLDDAEECLWGVYEDFCKLSGFINFPKKEMDEMLQNDFVCPLCILTDAYSDIGWTDYVCPKPTSDNTDVVSKRGVDTDLPKGACEHLLTVKKTQYDRLHDVDHYPE